jgi:hypothetical protein
MFKRLGMIAVGTLVAAGLGIPAASAQPTSDGSFTMTVNKTAYTNHWRTVITVSGTYKCSRTGGWTVTDSGMTAEVTQVQGRRYVVRGLGFTMGGASINCNGTSHKWSTDVQAMVNGMTPATWKKGYVAANIGGSVDGTCDTGGCVRGTHHLETSFDKVLQIVIKK